MEPMSASSSSSQELIFLQKPAEVETRPAQPKKKKKNKRVRASATGSESVESWPINEQASCRFDDEADLVTLR